MEKYSNFSTMDSLKTTDKFRKILYVGENGKYICENLVAYNYGGLSLNSAFNAYCWLREKLKKEEDLPDVIICDLELEEGSAYSLFDNIQSSPSLRKIPFIVISKNKNQINKIKAIKRGFDDLYCEPFTAEDLHNRIIFLEQFKQEKERLIQENFKKFENKIPLAKRVFDIVIAGFLLIMFCPVIILISLLIKLESRGPIFYVSQRVGTGYNIFNFYKFRSMRYGADLELKKLMHMNQYSKGKASFIKMKNDPRVTRLGKFLRKTSLDELPQLINVLKGDMSIVGNRPLPLYEAERLTKDIWAKRFLAPAGITGLWQVRRRNNPELTEEERMELDIQYAENYSLALDIKIFLKTIPAILQKETV
jgi:lipopolysaccharide/colanic/teichoic acid biosynthesis glycosyltransferase